MANPAIATISSEVSELLKIKYGPKLVELQNNTPMLYKMLSKSNRELRGDHYEFPARTAQAASIGPRGLRATLPPVVAAAQVTVKIFLKTLYATFDIPGPDMERAKGNMSSFVDNLDDKMKGIMQAAIKDANFQSYLSGTGQYAVTTNVGGAATDVIVDVIKYLRPNRRMDIWDTSANTVIASVDAAPDLAIASIAAATKTVTFNATKPGAIAVGDSLVPETGIATGGTAIGMFLNGLAAIVDDGTNVAVHQNVTRATTPLWKAHVFDKAGVDLTATDLQLLFDIPEMASGMQIDLILASQNGRKQYLDTLITQRRFMDKKFEGGYSVLDYNGKSFMVDVDCQDDVIYGLNRGSIQHYGAFEFAFDESDGNILKWVPRQDCFEGFLKAYVNLGTEQCNANAKYINVPVDSRYTSFAA